MTHRTFLFEHIKYLSLLLIQRSHSYTNIPYTVIAFQNEQKDPIVINYLEQPNRGYKNTFSASQNNLCSVQIAEFNFEGFHCVWLLCVLQSVTNPFQHETQVPFGLITITVTASRHYFFEDMLTETSYSNLYVIYVRSYIIYKYIYFYIFNMKFTRVMLYSNVPQHEILGL